MRKIPEIRRLGLGVMATALVVACSTPGARQSTQEPVATVSGGEAVAGKPSTAKRVASVASEGPLLSPEQVVQQFVRLVRGRELEGLVALYEPSAVFVPSPEGSVAGSAGIRKALEEMLSLQPELKVVTVAVHRAGDVALVSNEWTLSGRTPDGTPVHQQGTSAVVLRRQADASWRLLIDRP